MRNDSGRSSTDIVLGILVVVLASIFVLVMLRGLHLAGLSLGGWSLGGLFPHGAGHSLLPSYVWTFTGLGWLINLLLAVWVTLDANKRGMNGVLWGILVFFTCVVGLIVYLIVAGTSARNGTAPVAAAAASTPAPGPAASGSCPSCSGRIESAFRVCPYCGLALAGTCPHCGQGVQAGGKVCPNCTGGLEPAPPGGGRETSPSSGE